MNACDAKYAEFIIPFVYFSSLFNKGAAYEFLLSEKISNDLSERIKKLAGYLHSEIILRPTAADPMRARFVESPLRYYDYVYIGDIDIFILEDIVPFHLAQIKKSSMVYDNVARPNSDKMSGLQFCLYKYFELTKNVRNDKALFKRYQHNETLLFYMLQKAGLKIIQPRNSIDFVNARPIHGIHVSLNRASFRSDTMNFDCEKRFAVAFLEIIDRDEFKKVVKPLFSPWLNDIFNKVLPLLTEKSI